MAKQRQRNKRKDLRVKMDIIKKEQDDGMMLKTIRERNNTLVRTRRESRMQLNISKQRMSVDLEGWARKGYSTVRHSERDA